MGRTKAWWAMLTKQERSLIVYYERSAASAGCQSSMLPDDCHECPTCSTPHTSDGLCPNCMRHYEMLLHKADMVEIPA